MTRILAFGFAGACFAFLLGFLSFLSQIHAADRTKLAPVDAIVVFSGEPRRIRVATNLLKEGYGKRLLIVGQDNRDEVEKMRMENRSLFECCVETDHRSRNTAEDAYLARHLILKMRSQSLILVTSSFHMPRAKKELARLLPKVRIKSFGVSDDFFRIENILSDTNVSSAFLSQYILFLTSSIPGNRALLEDNSELSILNSTASFRNIGLVIITVTSLILANFALYKHRRRHHRSLKRKKSRSR